jgi:uncharacterized membrane-anchored protein
MLNAPLRIMLVAALCVLALIGLVVREGYERSRPPTLNARNIDMQMQAIDPRALLSGHYVIVSLQTRIVTHEDVAPCAEFAAVSDDESWVALAYNGPEFRIPPGPGTPLPYAPVGAARSREAAQAIADRTGGRGRGLAARGTASCAELSEDVIGPTPARVAAVQTQLVGVERFHAPQEEAERIDALMREQGADAHVFAIVNIGRDGRARLKGLNVNGEIIELNWL